MKYIASCSFGKDSLAQIIIGRYYNEPIDEVIYSEVMFTPEISGEFPEHRDFIYNVAIPKIKKVYNLETKILRSPRTMWDDFHRVHKWGVDEGKLRGFPTPGLCNINRDCKIPPISIYLAQQTDEVTQYIGFGADEPSRLKRLGPNQISLLAKYKITEEMAKDICKAAGLLSPIYEFTNRNGCFFCPNASDQEVRYLYDHHPELWAKLRELQETPNTSRRCLTRNKTIFDYEEQFQKERTQSK